MTTTTINTNTTLPTSTLLPPVAPEAASQSQARTPTNASLALLDWIRDVRAQVGEGLDDFELTCLLRSMPRPSEAGFHFLAFFQGVATLAVPPQNPASWYPDQGWVAPAKEKVALAIAAKYGLSVSEPPDEGSSHVRPPDGSAAAHHHLAFTNDMETVIVAHPRYLKVRLFGAAANSRHNRVGRAPIDLGPDLLPDLAAIYRV